MNKIIEIKTSNSENSIKKITDIILEKLLVN